MDLSDEWVEAAARALWGTTTYRVAWETVGPKVRDMYLRRARAALEAVAPLIAAQAWDEGFNAGLDDGLDIAELRTGPLDLTKIHAPTPNPYRERSES